VTHQASFAGAPEFDLKLAAKDVTSSGITIDFDVDEGTRAALARRFGILELQHLRGTASVRPFRKHGLTLDCRFEAVLAQPCVVTLDPMVQKVDESFTRRWLPEHLIELESSADGREILIEAEGEDAPEPMTGGAINIGEAVAEALALAIDPYPRKPGVAYNTPPDVPGAAAEERPNPFAVLEKFKKND
jgi:uncharacterized metal-binding protein YceD (DUF177 family)